MNWQNKTIWTGDNLPILRGMNSESVDLIYLDPPFNSNTNYAAPIGSEAAGAEFKDTWTLNEINLAWHGLIKHEHPGLYAMLTAVRMLHGESMMAYLIDMIPRLMELKRLLKPTGSIYLHCDPHASHYLKLVMDALFGSINFRREIVWKMPRPSGFKTRAANWARNHDIILYYAASETFTFHKQYEPYQDDYLKHFNRTDSEGKYWLRDGRKRRLGQGYTLGSTWTDIPSLQTQSVSRREGTGYPTQKPLALLERIIAASSNEGDMVLDPFCGSATTCLAAQRLCRRWVGIDRLPEAARWMQRRWSEELGRTAPAIIHRKDIPTRSDLEGTAPAQDIQT